MLHRRPRCAGAAACTRAPMCGGCQGTCYAMRQPDLAQRWCAAAAQQMPLLRSTPRLGPPPHASKVYQVCLAACRGPRAQPEPRPGPRAPPDAPLLPVPLLRSEEALPVQSDDPARCQQRRHPQAAGGACRGRPQQRQQRQRPSQPAREPSRKGDEERARWARADGAAHFTCMPGGQRQEALRPTRLALSLACFAAALARAANKGSKTPAKAYELRTRSSSLRVASSEDAVLAEAATPASDAADDSGGGCMDAVRNSCAMLGWCLAHRGS